MAGVQVEIQVLYLVDRAPLCENVEKSDLRSFRYS